MFLRFYIIILKLELNKISNKKTKKIIFKLKNVKNKKVNYEQRKRFYNNQLLLILINIK